MRFSTFNFVAAPPDFIVKPDDRKVAVNGVTTFTCSAHGQPPPSVFWSKEGNSQVRLAKMRRLLLVRHAHSDTAMVDGLASPPGWRLQ
jgi:hypothetical protein